MYYNKRDTVPVPGENPNCATRDNKHEWSYALARHQETLKNVKGLVDHSVPFSIQDRGIQKVQAETRHFFQKQKEAEIGRENRKLVDRLTSISKVGNGNDPRSPPPAVPKRSPGITRSYSSPLRPSAEASQFPCGSTSPGPIAGAGSLRASTWRKQQQTIEHENAHLVRRILAVKGEFDAKADHRDFLRHKRAVHILQKIPDGVGPRRGHPPSSLPPLRPPRPAANLSMPPRGLDGLFFLHDLQSERNDASPSKAVPENRCKSPLMRERNSASAMLSSQVEDSLEDDSRSEHSDEVYKGKLTERDLSPNGNGGQRQPPPLATTAPSGLDSQPDAALWPQQDDTERRRWTSIDQEDPPQAAGTEEVSGVNSQNADNSTAEDKEPPDMVQGASSASLGYDDEWDSDSMDSEGSPLRKSRSQATSGTLGRITSSGSVDTGDTSVE